MHQAASKPERHLPALAVSRGIGIGTVIFLHGHKRQFFRRSIDSNLIDTEIEKFRSAVEECKDQLKELSNRHNDQNQLVSEIFGVHLLIVQESSFIKKIETVIRDRQVNSEWALKVVSDQYLERQISVADQHLREKSIDIEDVSDRLLSVLIGLPASVRLTDPGLIIIARELRPSAIMELKKSSPAAIITERGGWTSHTSILAREFGLPMVSGVRKFGQIVSEGDRLIVDGFSGQVIVNPKIETIELFQRLADETVIRDELPAITNNSTATTDGTSIFIRANVDIPETYERAKLFGAEGIGLFRSESLISSPGSIPSEEEQMSAYRQLAAIAGSAGVNIRTFDVGIDQMSERGFSSERNPSLGLRSIRLSLSDTAYFCTQIRAILRTSGDQNLSIVLPMISGLSEVLLSKSIIKEECDRLSEEGIQFSEVKVGAMIEVPSAVLTINEIAQNVDFLCLGTNDLVQYLLAVDRDNDLVANWYQTLHPAVIRSISSVLEAGSERGIPVTLCGEMAGSVFYVPLLIGLGAREFSMNVNSIQQIRHLVSGISLAETHDLVKMARNCHTAEDTEYLLRTYYLKNWKDLFPPGLLSTKHS